MLACADTMLSRPHCKQGACVHCTFVACMPRRATCVAKAITCHQRRSSCGDTVERHAVTGLHVESAVLQRESSSAATPVPMQTNLPPHNRCTPALTQMRTCRALLALSHGAAAQLRCKWQP